MDIGYTGAFLGGILTLLSPCSVMLLPAFFAYAFTSPSALIGRTAIFYAGLSVTLVPLGIFSGSLGSLLTTHRMTLVTVAATVVILLGLWQLSGLPVPGLSRSTDQQRDSTSIGSVFALGAVYAVAGVCAGPILGSVLMVAAVSGSPIYGGSVLALYALGMTVPLFVLAAVWKRLGTRGRAVIAPKEVSIGPWRNTWAMVISGVLSIAIGVLLILTEGTASLSGVFTVSTQRSAESTLSSWSSGVSDVWFIVAAVVVLGGVALWRQRNGRRDSPTDGPSDAEQHSAGPDLVSRKK
ncbi:cytochrome c biogenesis CcdA family protein [Janibacter cremeus]|uniref:Cytochrome c biogenesis protein CcdA n=1 Tax=Janibacter cremeus TaxID=1285192 RepID=A0A852VXU0_9MICO|nr:cytochrome c biogenesis CcdA family protein [Janibacter cremeus]NYF98331.1 cytochrome c biogenesis protein CcdA [Janibacter cremeus]